MVTNSLHRHRLIPEDAGRDVIIGFEHREEQMLGPDPGAAQCRSSLARCSRVSWELAPSENSRAPRQMLAKVLGGSVARHPHAEIGWHELDRYAEAAFPLAE